MKTPIEYVLSLKWTKEDLEKAKKFLKNWDSRDDSYYKLHSLIVKDVDLSEREHYRNCVKFWENKLNET